MTCGKNRLASQTEGNHKVRNQCSLERLSAMPGCGVLIERESVRGMRRKNEMDWS